MKNNNISTLIKKSIRGNSRAQLQLYDQYCDAMFTVCCRYIKDEEDAKDIMQEGFIKAFQHLSSYNCKVSFGAWLKRIIINTAIDYLKKKQLNTISYNEQTIDIPDNNNWIVDATINKEMIMNAINNLQENYRIVANLYLLEGYDHEEISSILNIPVKTSRTQLHRARLKLQTALKHVCYEQRH